MNIYREVTKRLSPFMKSCGFSLSGRTYSYLSNDIAYCLSMDAPSGLLYVTVYVIPLYVPCEARYYTYGNRIHTISNNILPPLRKDGTTEIFDEWCKEFCTLTEERILPFFNNISTPDNLIKYITHCHSNKSVWFSCPDFHIERLKLFTYLYLNKLPEAEKTLVSYKEMLHKNKYFTDSVRNVYLNEIMGIKSLMRKDEEEKRDYFRHIIFATTNIL